MGYCVRMGKVVDADAASKAADAALQCYSGCGLVEGHSMFSHFIAARLGKVAPANREIILNYMGENLLD